MPKLIEDKKIVRDCAAVFGLSLNLSLQQSDGGTG
jgi:hypothetical protein